MVKTLILCVLTGLAMAEDLVLSPEATIEKDPSGRFLVITDPRNKVEYLIKTERIIFVKSANIYDNNSYTDITVGLSETDRNGTVLKIQQRLMPYEQIKQILMK